MDKFEKLLKETEYVVEATSAETFFLWERHAADHKMFETPYPKCKWEQLPTGYAETIGTVKGHPVCVCCMWNRIDGHLVMFYEVTSRMVDHDMVEKWLEKKCNPQWQGCRAYCDANNFGHVLQFVKDAVCGHVKDK